MPLPRNITATVRHLVIVLGDQLDLQSSALQDFDPAQDVVWMAEVTQESTHVWSAKQRITVFLSAMRHFAQDLHALGLPLLYTCLDDDDNRDTLALQLYESIKQLHPAAHALCGRRYHARCYCPGQHKICQSPWHVTDFWLASAPRPGAVDLAGIHRATPAAVWFV
jgi:deoxyribodipyrimidine photolyase